MSEGDAVYRVRPAAREDLDWIFRLEIDAYSAEYAVARRTLDEWYCANPEGFSVLTMNGEKVGQITLLPLRPALLEGFDRGTILEQEIRGADLYAPAERELVRNLHAESIIIRSPQGRSMPPLKALMCLGRNFITLIGRVCEPANLENVYALGASGRGQSFMTGLGFRRVASAHGETVPRGLYVAPFHALKTSIAGLYQRRLRNNKT
ncbi:MAG TPA: hypothetical protein VN256_03665 [Pyrinomonadaceae bacterium]|nr:hypothetical protein [Pyrinomonadaceae bacterium]